MSNKQYDFSRDTFQYLDAGVFQQKVDAAVKGACAAVAAYGDKGKKGKVVIEMTVTRIGESSQVHMDHKLKTETPTEKGKKMEENTTSTPLHVTAHGPSILPNDQVDAFGTENQSNA